MAATTETPVLPGEFDGYRVLRPLSSGAMGTVYLARDLLLERDVAIKILHDASLDRAARERFGVEAKALARVQHPNVATIHRVGEVGGRPYLAAELVRGQSLDLLPKPVPPDRLLSMAIDLARGLSAAHKKGVLHRDLKPANAVLSDDGAVKLIDFGLAELLDADAPAREGARLAIGTPSYMPPEAWLEEPLDACSDLYSLGALLYDLAAGEPPHRGVTELQLATAVTEQDALPLTFRVPLFPEDFAAIIDRCLRRDPAARFPTAEALLSELLAIAPRGASAEIPPGNPYRSLNPFREEHRALFFGRSRDVNAIVERLLAEPLVVIAGSSGVGKSSLAHAGVLPAIREDVLGGGRRWSAVALVPGQRPLARLIEALAQIDDPAKDGLDAAAIREDPHALAEWLRDRLGRSRGLVLLVDQLEEIETLSDRVEAEAAAEALAGLAAGLPGIRVLTTARSDFLTRLAALPNLGALLSSAVYLPRPFDGQDLREIITGPARVKGFRFESNEMIEALIDAMGRSDAKLPLLEFALAELWERRREDTALIPQAALQEVGGVDGALTRHADEILARLLPVEREAARRVLVRCVSADRTRTRVPEEELLAAAPGADVQAERRAIDALVSGRLLVARGADAGGDRTTYELAHEALIDRWETLREWINADGDRRAVEDRLARAAREWERHGRDDELAWTPKQLEELRRVGLEQAELRPVERALVERSRALARRRRLSRVAMAVALPAALGLSYGAVKLDASRRTQRSIDQIAAEAGQTIRQAQEAQQALEARRTEVLSRFDSGDEAAESAWSEVIAQSRGVQLDLGRAIRLLERGLALDGSSPKLRALLADALSEQATLAGREHRDAEREHTLERLASYDDRPERLARWSAPASITLDVRPAGAEVTVRTYSRQDDGDLSLGPPRELGRTPAAIELEPGSHLLSFSHGQISVRAPVRVTAGENLALTFDLPPSIPEGFVFVPPGRFLFGSIEEGSCRAALLSAQPLHEIVTEGFFIAKHEVTFAEWIEYLDALEPAERAARRPRVERERGGVSLDELAPRQWRLSFRPTEASMVAGIGEPVFYAGRTRNARADWTRFPVLGVSPEDAVAYTRWLDRTGRVPGARLCTEHEWERAARGADGRNYPHGDRLTPEQANHDRAYGRHPLGFGPDEVGAHPASVSPFGVHDLAGNAWEITRSVSPGDEFVGRGGGWYEDAAAAMSANRMHAEPTMRDPVVGFRVCIDEK